MSRDCVSSRSELHLFLLNFVFIAKWISRGCCWVLVDALADSVIRSTSALMAKRPSIVVAVCTIYPISILRTLSWYAITNLLKVTIVTPWTTYCPLSVNSTSRRIAARSWMLWKRAIRKSMWFVAVRGFQVDEAWLNKRRIINCSTVNIDNLDLVMGAYHIT